MWMDATAQADLVRSGEASPSELVGAAIERIESLDPVLGAVVSRQFERARAEADRPLPDGPFRGVPILVKDLGAQQAGEPYHMGSGVLRDVDYRAPVDSYLVRRLTGSGAIILGRTNTPEFATSPTTEPVAYGPTRNPWNVERSTGGSSGGSAAAVAAGMVAVAHGSDGGGSIRIPASCCGLVGLKPSRGRISRGPQQGEGWGGASTDGCLTRSVRDTAGLLDAMFGTEPGDPYSAPDLPRRLIDELGVDPGVLRVGVLDHPPQDGFSPDPDGQEAVRSAVELLESLGHSVEAIHPAALDEQAFATHYAPLVCVAVSQSLLSWSAVLGRDIAVEEFEPVNQLLASLGSKYSGAEYLDNLSWLHAWSRRLSTFWEPTDRGGTGFDLLLTPVVGMSPPALGRLSDAADPITAMTLVPRFIPYTAQFNVSGQPAISLPLSTTADGLPMGVQLVSAMYREDVLIQVASQLEAAAPWVARRPSLSSPLSPSPLRAARSGSENEPLPT